MKQGGQPTNRQLGTCNIQRLTFNKTFADVFTRVFLNMVVCVCVFTVVTEIEEGQTEILLLPAPVCNVWVYVCGLMMMICWLIDWLNCKSWFNESVNTHWVDWTWVCPYHPDQPFGRALRAPRPRWSRTCWPSTLGTGTFALLANQKLGNEGSAVWLLCWSAATLQCLLSTVGESRVEGGVGGHDKVQPICDNLINVAQTQISGSKLCV